MTCFVGLIVGFDAGSRGAAWNERAEESHMAKMFASNNCLSTRRRSTKAKGVGDSASLWPNGALRRFLGCCAIMSVERRKKAGNEGNIV
jgi:hypothetical protein